MVTSLEVIDEVSDINFKIDGTTISSYSKVGMTLTISGDLLIVKAANGDTRSYDYTKVINPTYSSVELFRAAVKSMLEISGDTSLLQQIADNTAEIKIDADSVSLNTDGLEAQIANIEVAIGDPPDAVASSDTGSFSLLAFAKLLQTKFTTLNSNVAKDGTDMTTPTAMPTGGVGIRGWLSAIWTKLNGTINVAATIDTSLLATESTLLALKALNTFEIQKGLVSGVSIVNKSGRNSVITSASAPEDMWNGSAVYSGFPTGSPEVLEFFSSSASDTGVVTYQYLATSASTAWQTATVTLNGVTPVIGVSAWRVHTANYNNGSTANVGTITCRHTTTTTNIFFIMPVGTSQTYVAAYTIPEGSTGFIKKVFCDVNTTNAVSMQGVLWIRLFGESPRLQRNFNVSNNINYKDDNLYIKITEQTDITMRITQSSSAATQAVIGGFDLIIINQTL